MEGFIIVWLNIIVCINACVYCNLMNEDNSDNSDSAYLFSLTFSTLKLRSCHRTQFPLITISCTVRHDILPITSKHIRTEHNTTPHHTQVCDHLIEDDDLSGSTGVIVVYDGRRNVLTVANVGDSMCVLSRGGRAVNMHRMHRLDDAEERARVEAAGGTVIKNRYGTLRYITV